MKDRRTAGNAQSQIINRRSPILKAILFDAGDTLFRLRGSVGEVYARHAAQHGVALESAPIELRFRAAFRAAPPLAFPGAASTDLPRLEYGWWHALVRQVFHDARFADFEAFFRELFDYFAAAEAWQVFDDTLPTLGALKQRGLKLAVVSNFDGRLFDICAGLGITDYVDTIVPSGRAGAAKPDPKIFHVALSRLAVDPGAAVHVGDSLSEDVHGAEAAGLRALLLQRKPDAQTSGDAIGDLHRLDEIVGWAPPTEM